MAYSKSKFMHMLQRILAAGSDVVKKKMLIYKWEVNWLLFSASRHWTNTVFTWRIIAFFRLALTTITRWATHYNLKNAYKTDSKRYDDDNFTMVEDAPTHLPNFAPLADSCHELFVPGALECCCSRGIQKCRVALACFDREQRRDEVSRVGGVVEVGGAVWWG